MLGVSNSPHASRVIRTAAETAVFCVGSLLSGGRPPCGLGCWMALGGWNAPCGWTGAQLGECPSREAESTMPIDACCKLLHLRNSPCRNRFLPPRLPEGYSELAIAKRSAGERRNHGALRGACRQLPKGRSKTCGKAPRRGSCKRQLCPTDPAETSSEGKAARAACCYKLLHAETRRGREALLKDGRPWTRE